MRGGIFTATGHRKFDCLKINYSARVQSKSKAWQLSLLASSLLVFEKFPLDWLKSGRTHEDERGDGGGAAEGRTSGRCSAGLAPGGGEEMRREERRGEGNIRGGTLTCEMLSGLAADMTASVPIDGAIGLPSPSARCSFARHSRARRGAGPPLSRTAFVGNNICICQHRFYSPLGFYRLSGKSLKGFSCLLPPLLPSPWLCTLKRPWQNMTGGKYSGMTTGLS